MNLTRVELITVPFPSATPIARANVQVKRLELEALNPTVGLWLYPEFRKETGPGGTDGHKISLVFRWCKIGATGTLLATLQIFPFLGTLRWVNQ
jgi:hypothetical protein